MKAISKIYLVWRKGKGSRRRIVGHIKNNSTKGTRFSYDLDGVKAAMQDGFSTYTDFPKIDIEYKENVIAIFSKRLLKTERSDIKKYNDFWAIDPKYKDDKLYMLAYTQGMLSTDNFEFIADFHPVKDLHFVSEISGLSYSKLKADVLSEGDLLTWKLEKDNPKDDKAVKIFKGDIDLGYVKQIHSRVFHKHSKTSLKIRVKSIDKNGTINRVFIDVFY